MDVGDFYGVETLATLGIVVPDETKPYPGNYDTATTADLLGYTRTGIHRLLQDGRLIGIKAGSKYRGQWWIPAREITRFLDAREREAPHPGRPRKATRRPQ